MTIEERITALEMREDRRESEHAQLLKTYGEVLEGREKLRRELETDYQFLGQAFDARIGELTKTLAGAAPGDMQPVLLELAHIVFAEMGKHVSELHQRIFDARVEHAQIVKKLAEGVIAVSGRDAAPQYITEIVEGLNNVFDRVLRIEEYLAGGRRVA